MMAIKSDRLLMLSSLFIVASSGSGTWVSMKREMVSDGIADTVVLLLSLKTDYDLSLSIGVVHDLLHVLWLTCARDCHQKVP